LGCDRALFLCGLSKEQPNSIDCHRLRRKRSVKISVTTADCPHEQCGNVGEERQDMVVNGPQELDWAHALPEQYVEGRAPVLQQDILLRGCA